MSDERILRYECHLCDTFATVSFAVDANPYDILDRLQASHTFCCRMRKEHLRVKHEDRDVIARRMAHSVGFIQWIIANPSVTEKPNLEMQWCASDGSAVYLIPSLRQDECGRWLPERMDCLSEMVLQTETPTAEDSQGTTATGSAPDPIKPPHYQGTIECIDAIESLGIGKEFCRATALKYLWRMGRKGDALTDARKAKWYLERLVKQLEAEAQ